MWQVSVGQMSAGQVAVGCISGNLQQWEMRCRPYVPLHQCTEATVTPQAPYALKDLSEPSSS